MAAMKSAHTEAPKKCINCGKRTAKPEYWTPSLAAYRNPNIWPHSLLLSLRCGGIWIVRCTNCPTIHVWSFPNVYKVFVDPMPQVVLGET